jgi:hypothetical protein
VGFVVNDVVLGRVLSDYFGFPLPILIPPTAPHTLTILLSDVTSFRYWVVKKLKVTLRVLSIFKNEASRPCGVKLTTHL